MYQKQQPKIVPLDMPPRMHTSKNMHTVMVQRGIDKKLLKHLQENAKKQVKWNSPAWREKATRG